MNKIIEKEINWIKEQAYRKGFSHGFTVGSEAHKDDIEDYKCDINTWQHNKKNDYQRIGAPGTFLQGQIICDFNK